VNKKIVIFVVLSLLAFSCSENINIKITGSLSGEVNIPVPGNENALVGTKALDPNFNFSWNVGDKVSIFTGEVGEMMIYRIKTVEGTVCHFNVNKFKLKDMLYYSISPSQGNSDDPSQIPLSLEGQIQSANNNTEHLTKYDYNVGSATIMNNSGNFAYSHIVDWVRLVVSVPFDMTFKSMTIVPCNSNALITEADLNLVTGVITPTKTSSNITLGLSDIVVKGGEKLTAFITLFPEDMRADGITVSLIYEDVSGVEHNSLKTFKPKTTWVAGKYYTYRYDMPIMFTTENMSYGIVEEGVWGDNGGETFGHEYGSWGDFEGSNESDNSENGSWGDNSGQNFGTETGNW